ncbi:hypothetical protein IFM46972_06188 [Aspergillus udagawae]|uniref:Uncharacterized protein n=1 Tax=Aspergillus udagawae TaxID=91492 RepID=A0A8H3NV84_9EURO|nr:hypothetical protein IFM46972_06188 [Aspergillus udagawae]
MDSSAMEQYLALEIASTSSLATEHGSPGHPHALEGSQAARSKYPRRRIGQARKFMFKVHNDFYQKRGDDQSGPNGVQAWLKAATNSAESDRRVKAQRC